MIVAFLTRCRVGNLRIHTTHALQLHCLHLPIGKSESVRESSIKVRHRDHTATSTTLKSKQNSGRITEDQKQRLSGERGGRSSCYKYLVSACLSL